MTAASRVANREAHKKRTEPDPNRSGRRPQRKDETRLSFSFSSDLSDRRFFEEDAGRQGAKPRLRAQAEGLGIGGTTLPGASGAGGGGGVASDGTGVDGLGAVGTGFGATGATASDGVGVGAGVGLVTPDGPWL